MEKEKKNKKGDIIIKGDDNKEIVIPKYKQKAMLDHFMILLGVIAAIFVFMIIFDLFFEGSVLGLLFDNTSWTNYWDYMILGDDITGQTPIYDRDDILFKGTWMPTTIYSLVFLICIIGVIALIIRYIRDYIEVFKGIFKAFGDLRKGAIGSIKEAMEPVDVVAKKKDIVGAEKSKFITELSPKELDLDTLIEENREKKKRGPKPKKKAEDETSAVIDAEEAELNRLLMGGEPASVETIKVADEDDFDPNYQTKSLFADKD